MQSSQKTKVKFSLVFRVVVEIYKAFDEAGYYCQHFLLDASKMGVPQRRERVFFICIRKDLGTQFLEQVDLFLTQPKIEMEFCEKEILFGEFIDEKGSKLSELMAEIWGFRCDGDNLMSQAYGRYNGKYSYFSQSYLYKDKTPPTLTSHKDSLVLFDAPRFTSKTEVLCIGSYPQDYNFKKIQPHYLIGMSVPPLMTAKIAKNIYDQWLSKIKQ